VARLWYLAQIYPPPEECVRQLNTTISWYVLRGEIFRVPLSTLQRRKVEGGWNLLHITAKSCALFLYRLRQQGLRSGTLTAEWLCSWVLMAQNKNPPYRDRIPATLEYLRRYAVVVSYVTQQWNKESQSTYKRQFTTLFTTCVGRQQNPRRCGSPTYGHKQPGLQYGKTWGKHLFLRPLKRHIR